MNYSYSVEIIWPESRLTEQQEWSAAEWMRHRMAVHELRMYGLIDTVMMRPIPVRCSCRGALHSSGCRLMCTS